MTYERNQVTEYVEFYKQCLVNLRDNRSILAYSKCAYHVVANLDDSHLPIGLPDVLYLPELDKNLLSVRAMVKLGAIVQFKSEICEITRSGKLLARGKIERMLLGNYGK